MSLPEEVAIPDGMPQHASYWYRRWLVAQEELDEEAAQRISLHARVRELEAAAPLIAAAERERIYDQLGHDHYVIFTDDGWTVEHSVDCRLAGDMTSGCDYWTALKYADVTDAPDPEMLGRWRIDGIDSEGLPSLTRAEPVVPSDG